MGRSITHATSFPVYSWRDHTLASSEWAGCVCRPLPFRFKRRPMSSSSPCGTRPFVGRTEPAVAPNEADVFKTTVDRACAARAVPVCAVSSTMRRREDVFRVGLSAAGKLPFAHVPPGAPSLFGFYDDAAQLPPKAELAAAAREGFDPTFQARRRHARGCCCCCCCCCVCGIFQARRRRRSRGSCCCCCCYCCCVCV